MKNPVKRNPRLTAILSGSAAAITSSGALLNTFGHSKGADAFEGFIIGLAATVCVGTFLLYRRGCQSAQ